MLHRSHRPTAALAALLVLFVLPSCSVGGASPASAPAPSTSAGEPAGHRTVVERRTDGVALVVEVLEGPAGTAATWSGVGPGERLLLAEEVRIGDDVWVHLAATEAGGVTEPAWIHIDLTQAWQREFHDANPLGLVEQRLLWDAAEGDEIDGGEVVAVDEPSPTERVLHLASGEEVHVSREELHRPPTIEPPDSLPVVPLREVEALLARR